jgi:hypothetical protein
MTAKKGFKNKNLRLSLQCQTLMVEYIHGKFSKDYMRDFIFKLNYRLYNGTKRRNWPDQNHFFIKKGSEYDQIHP